MRDKGSVRGRLRELQLDVCAYRPDRALLDAVRRAPRAQIVRASLLPVVGPEDRRVSPPMDAGARARTVAAAGSAEQDPRMAGRGRRTRQAHRLGHLARRAVFRDPDTRRARQVLLRVARRAGRLPRLAQELLRDRQGEGERRAARLRGVPGRGGHGAVSLHRQGHRLLPHAVLAGDARVRRRAVPGADQCVRPRLPDRAGREDVEVAGHRDQSRLLPRPRPGRRMAALLPRGEAQRSRRGYRLQSRRLHRTGQQRPRRKVRQHREPCGAVRRGAGQRDRAHASRSRRGTRSRRRRSREPSPSTTTPANSARPCARSCSWPTSRTSISTARSHGSSRRIPRRRDARSKWPPSRSRTSGCSRCS